MYKTIKIKLKGFQFVFYMSGTIIIFYRESKNQSFTVIICKNKDEICNEIQLFYTGTHYYGWCIALYWKKKQENRIHDVNVYKLLIS